MPVVQLNDSRLVQRKNNGKIESRLSMVIQLTLVSDETYLRNFNDY